MGLIHSRASKKRAKAEAALLKDELRQRKEARRREQAGDSVLLQPTLADAVRKLRRRGAS